MRRLSALDASFASLDSPSTPMEVGMACTFDPATAPGDWSIGDIRRTVEERLPLVPPFRRRLVDVPGRFHRPVWIEEPRFDLDRHVRPQEMPPSAGTSELADLSAEIIGKRLDRNRPLWEMRLVEGMEDGQAAAVTKVHHAAIDGVSGAEATVRLLDFEPSPEPVLPDDEWEADPEPQSSSLVADAMGELGRLPGEAARHLSRTAKAGLQFWRHARQAAGERLPAPFAGPRTSINRPLTGRRSVAYTKVELPAIRPLRDLGTTVNDIVLALSAGALRRYLGRRGERPDHPLVAAVPVSVRTDDEGGAMGNRLSGLLVDLATEVDDPIERLRRISAGARTAKERDQMLGPDAVSSLAELAPPALLTTLSAMDDKLGLSGHLPPLCNVVVSSFPGPAEPLYFAGAKMTAAYPLGPLVPGSGLNITVQSYLDTLWFGLVACPDVIYDVGEVAADLDGALEELLDGAAIAAT